MLTVFFLIGGIIVLYFGAEILIKGSTDLALKIGIKPLVVGMTVVAYGTSSPELIVSVDAALSGNPGIALGNVIGSNICNIALILGLAAVISPMKVETTFIKKEIPVLFAVTVLFCLLLLDKELSRIDGAVLLVILIVHFYMGYSSAKKEKNKKVENEFAEEYHSSKRSMTQNIFYLIGGFLLLAAGAHFFVEGAIKAAKFFGLSEVVIGLTIVAVGTSLPELATSVIAAIKKESDIALGNVIGSNIFNILGIIGLAAVISPFKIPELNYMDLGVMAGISLIVLPMAKTGMKFVRAEGAVLLAGYLFYVFYLLFNTRVF